jgi:hypothetical protein
LALLQRAFLRSSGIFLGRAARDWDVATNQPLAVVESTFDSMKHFSVFATLATASGGSAYYR